jgi:methionyl-tRNA synthetase
MDRNIKKCLFCQHENLAERDNCDNCGMLLSSKQQNIKQKNRQIFLKVFWLVVIFCAVMIVYLPR